MDVKDLIYWPHHGQLWGRNHLPNADHPHVKGFTWSYTIERLCSVGLCNLHVLSQCIALGQDTSPQSQSQTAVCWPGGHVDIGNWKSYYTRQHCHVCQIQNQKKIQTTIWWRDEQACLNYTWIAIRISCLGKSNTIIIICTVLGR